MVFFCLGNKGFRLSQRGFARNGVDDALMIAEYIFQLLARYGKQCLYVRIDVNQLADALWPETGH